MTMAKKDKDLILRITFVNGHITDYEVGNKNDMSLLLHKIAKAIDDHKSVSICNGITMNANNILFIEEIDNGYKA